MSPKSDALRRDILHRLGNGPKTTREIALGRDQLYNAKHRREIQESLRYLHKSGQVELLDTNPTTQEFIYCISPDETMAIDNRLKAVWPMGRPRGRPKTVDNQEVVNLRSHGMSAIEISKLMDISTETVYAALREVAPHLLRLPKPPRTECKKGHRLSEDSIFRSADGYVRCRLCWKSAQENYLLRNSERKRNV